MERVLRQRISRTHFEEQTLQPKNDPPMTEPDSQNSSLPQQLQKNFCFEYSISLYLLRYDYGIWFREPLLRHGERDGSTRCK